MLEILQLKVTDEARLPLKVHFLPQPDFVNGQSHFVPSLATQCISQNEFACIYSRKKWK